MNLRFSEYFYHDVQIKAITFHFEQIERSNTIAFLLCENGDDDNDEKEIECSFIDVFDSFSSFAHNIVGGVFIMAVEVSNDNDYLLNYKNRNVNYLSKELLDALTCYVIYTTNGSIKIIASEDIQIL